MCVNKMLSTIRPTVPTGNCEKCKSTMYVGVLSKVCGHVACKSCFSRCNFNCPICNAVLRKEDIYENPEVEKIFARCCSWPLTNLSGSSIKYLFTPEKPKEKVDHRGETRLHKACREGSLSTVKNLLSENVNINVQDFAGWTPLHEAVFAKWYDIAQLLLENGALVNVPGENYRTPLHIAVEQKNVLFVELLLIFGASALCHNSAGKTPIELCKLYENKSVLRTLLFINRDPDIPIVFSIPEPVVVLIGVKDTDRFSSILGLTEVNVPSFMCNKSVNYVIIGDKIPNAFHLQMAILQGAFVFTAEGFLKFIENKLQNPLTYLMDVPNYAISESVMNKLYMRPPLFDRMRFYFDSISTCEIDGFTYRSENIKQLVISGGGVVLKRKPSRLPVSHLPCVPYHAAKNTSLMSTTTYIIFNDNSRKKYDVQTNFELKYKPFSWFINCINTFSIK